jgi:nucleotide-binding universal stress UspA family protein
MTQTVTEPMTESDRAPSAIASSLAAAAAGTEHLPDGPQRIVVGLDGSPGSLRALLFAAQEAQVRHGVLHLVSAYDVSSMSYGYAGGMNIGFDASAWEDGLRGAAEERLKEAADTVAALVPGASEHLKTTVVEGRASQVLLEAARGATMLVVGSRGVGALTRLLLGSTSTEVVHHARLPVTVVPADENVDQDAGRGLNDNRPVGPDAPQRPELR